MNTTLIIMAAGIGSRFGGGIKQLTEMGKNKELIIDYSIYDAIQAGFNKVVFIIRKDIEQEFKEKIGNRISQHIQVGYVYQDLNDLPEGYSVPEGRKKPWGTGQAILCCKGIVKEPFVIINADDYYGKEAFVQLHEYLISHSSSPDHFNMAMAGFILKNTLSKNGTVTRGICVVDEDLNLTDIYETRGIQENEHGKIVCDNESVQNWITKDHFTSMNMWAGYPDFIDYLQESFIEFLNNLNNFDPQTKEYLLPEIVGQLLEKNKASVKVLKTNDSWFGITYMEDKQRVQNEFAQLIEKGVYPEKLWD
ncbi:nucleotidyltransferase family protein [Floccifex sp.]|uniref:nucleotidyltransferase family protein n=1 Tax=Floccifex sp. TaxID=2815810 RepID=UPI002A7531DA|nr:sugar phosphate nucleotidyltransferase [Floccifex sp.]MDD7280919.1 sugar phosphate nucleotidyltransferase [Erysipelotrichaceae bacterium]MDY2957992.1 sugar phosphate nucleotidyltransferase [Floccifex sp.]